MAIYAIDFVCQVFIGKQVFIKRFPLEFAKRKLFQSLDVVFGPPGFCVFVPVPQGMGVDPLFKLFLKLFMVIAHPDIVPDVLIL